MFALKIFLTCLLVNIIRIPHIDGLPTEIKDLETTTIPVIGRQYTLSFDVQPTKYGNTWNSIITFRSQTDTLGRRTKGVMFTGGVRPGRLRVCSPNFPFCYTTTRRFLVGFWVNVRLTQALYLEEYIFKIYVNGEEEYSMTNPIPRAIRNIEVRNGDKRYPPQPGYIKNLNFNFYCPKKIIQDPIEITGNNHLATLEKTKKDYTVCFDFMQNQVHGKVSTVVSLERPQGILPHSDTIGLPVVLTVLKTKMIYVCTETNMSLSSCFSTSRGFHISHWINMKISQSAFGKRYLFKIIVNGKELYSVVNKNPQDFKGVKVFAGSKHHTPLDGFIRNLNIDGNCPTYHLMPNIPGPDQEQNETAGSADWGPWAAYNKCSKTCGGGEQFRSRACRVPAVQCTSSNGKRAIIETVSRKCNSDDCPVHGMWGKWRVYEKCSKACGVGQEKRIRLCDAPTPTNGGLLCLESDGSGNRGTKRNVKEVLSERCNTHPCIVNGAWGQWTAYTTCSTTCGGGVHIRTRYCNNVTASRDGLQCLRLDGTRGIYETTSTGCDNGHCPVNGNWGKWSNVTACSRTCGDESYVRTRECNNPEPIFGGLLCRKSDGRCNEGEGRGEKETMTVSCNHQSCIVPTCKSLADIGFVIDSSGSVQHYYQQEKDLIKYFAEAFNVKAGGAHAGVVTFSDDVKISIKLDQCKDMSCFKKAVDGIKFMGGGTRIDKGLNLAWKSLFSQNNGGRSNVGRIIIIITDGIQTVGDDPVQIANDIRKSGINLVVIGIGGGISKEDLNKIGGGTSYTANTWELLKDNAFVGNLTRSICEQVQVGGWSEWITQGKCSKTCGGGEQVKTRYCNNPVSSPDGKMCLKSDNTRGIYETASTGCNTQRCPVDGHWGKWNILTDCSTSCRDGKYVRSRQCNNPAPAYGGLPCLTSDGVFNRGLTRGSKETVSLRCNIYPEKRQWTLQATNICFGTKQNRYGEFRINKDGELVSIRLEHRSGYVSCGRPVKYRSNWGCVDHPLYGNYIGIFITGDVRNRIIFPKYAVHMKSKTPMEADSWYSLPAFDANKKTLSFTDNATPLNVYTGQRLRIWYGEDYNDFDEGNNHGTSCVDVYAKII